MMAPKKSHQKASHRWHCSVLNSARWFWLMRRMFSCSHGSAAGSGGRGKEAEQQHT